MAVTFPLSVLSSTETSKDTSYEGNDGEANRYDEPVASDIKRRSLMTAVLDEEGGGKVHGPDSGAVHDAEGNGLVQPGAGIHGQLPRFDRRVCRAGRKRD